MNKEETYQLLGNILALDIVTGNKEIVAETIDKFSVNWNGFVKLGSDNLVLPAVYSNLSRHGLITFLPADLNEYLKDIFVLNSNRNTSIIDQAGYVKQLLLKSGIESLFMKGVGNILDGLYPDIGHRMVYDMDILVEKEKMTDAANIMKAEGFYSRKHFNPGSLESTMHYPILLREDFAAGVEIHRRPTQYLYTKGFEPEKIIENSVKTKDGFRVMQIRHRIIHNFLHAQLMHSGHYHADVSLRDLYDLLLLGQKEDLYHTFRQYNRYLTPATAYLKLTYNTFGAEMPAQLRETDTGDFFLWRHRKVMQMKTKNLNRYHLLLLMAQKYVILPLRVLWNPGARNYVFSRLTDRKWYKTHSEAMKRQFGRK